MGPLAPSILALLAWSAPAPERATITLLAFSDYHSHAVPFYSEGRPRQGGIARAVAFLRAERARAGTLVLSGGDMMNRGTPAWSDEHRCVEWPWLDGIVDAMALGNHDLDYGPDVFTRCRQGVRYPVLSANLVTAEGSPALAVEGKPYLVREALGRRIGVFAVAGPDVQRLVRTEDLPAGTRWTDAVGTARAVVRVLREQEGADAVVLIGHQLREDDEALARAVPGIDLILGTHSHHKGDLVTIPGATTRFLSPYQYLTYVSRVLLRFEGRRLTGIEGGLVRMDESRREDPGIRARVETLQAELVARRPERFAVLGRVPVALSDDGVSSGASVIGGWATEVLRRAAGAHAFLSTASSFRAGIPPGDVTVEDFLAAIPYPNRIAVAEMTGAQVADLLALSLSKAGSGGFAQQSGLRYAVRDGRPVDVHVLRDPASPSSGDAPLDLAAVYRVGATDFMAFVAAGYKERFAAAAGLRRTDLDCQALLKAALGSGLVPGGLDGRAPEQSR